MKNEYHIAMGWGLVASIIISAMVALPVLAGASASVKDKARWEQRAQAFEASRLNTADTSSYTVSLVDGYARQSRSSVWSQDLQMSDPLSISGSEMVVQANAASRETQCLAEAIYYEARSETTSGQKAVAEVVLNRVKSKHFPASICGVVYQGAQRTTGCQFSFSCDGSMAILPYGKSWARSQTIAQHMVMGISAPLTRRATHYHTTGVNPKWAPHLRMTRQYDTHVFYRFMPRKSRIRSVSVAP